MERHFLRSGAGTTVRTANGGASGRSHRGGEMSHRSGGKQERSRREKRMDADGRKATSTRIGESACAEFVRGTVLKRGWNRAGASGQNPRCGTVQALGGARKAGNDDRLPLPMDRGRGGTSGGEGLFPRIYKGHRVETDTGIDPHPGISESRGLAHPASVWLHRPQFGGMIAVYQTSYRLPPRGATRTADINTTRFWLQLLPLHRAMRAADIVAARFWLQLLP